MTTSFSAKSHLLHADSSLLLGCERDSLYLPILSGHRIALFSNQTGIDRRGIHTLDRLLSQGLQVTTLFGPEHGFRGTADAGEHVRSSIDEPTGIPIRSLYDGGDTGPSDTVMQDFDILVVDIQDVGLRFYTYYISMLKLMNRCGQTSKQVVLLDRPNPTGHYVDGPLLEDSLHSGVGALPIPVVHGLTLGELALMAQGEGWVQHPCSLSVIPCQGYTHHTLYSLPVPPSPNLPDMRSIYLYASICPFEGTTLSLGRGTEHPFQMYGHPMLEGCSYTFTPRSMPGAKNPPLLGEECHGVDLTSIPMEEIERWDRIHLEYVIDAYQRMRDKKHFFGKRARFFDLLMGTTRVREMIASGASCQEIRHTWQSDVRQFLRQRKPYLLYP
ncbi:MAG: exo-beta-N-acetylmuramidase NamZ domain-containing protein [Bacteroidaceae bacterium]